jgi:hypothetical protein
MGDAARNTIAIIGKALSGNEADHNIGWGARIRTWEWRNQNPLPYHLATPQNLSGAGGHMAKPARRTIAASAARFNVQAGSSRPSRSTLAKSPAISLSPMSVR